MRDQDNEVWEDMKVKGVFWEKLRFTLVSEVFWKKNSNRMGPGKETTKHYGDDSVGDNSSFGR